MWKKWFLNSLWNLISSVAWWVNEENYNLVSVSAIEKLTLPLKSSFLLFAVILNSFGHNLETAAVIIPAAETFSYLFAEWCPVNEKESQFPQANGTTGSLIRFVFF